MTARGDRLLQWSVRAYGLLLRAFPAAFRRDYGEQMTQLFADLARAAWRSSGTKGLVTVWMRSGHDAIRALGTAYRLDTRTVTARAAWWVAVIYACALASTAVVAGLHYREFYERPAFSNVGNPQPLEENAAIAAHRQALASDWGQYRTYARAAGVTIGVLLGLVAALFGLSQHSLLHGAAALAAGAGAALLVFEGLPSLWLPFDRYSLAFVWAVSGLPLAAAIWMVTTAAGWIGHRPSAAV